MENNDIRWKQRFDNFSKALSLLEKALQIENPDFLQKAGIIQFFEMSFELSWNMVKDYLEEQGFIDVKSPRSALKKAFEIDLISDGHSWMDLLVDRNLTSHTYDEDKATEVENLIHHKYFPLLKELYNSFKNKIDVV
jgi:nucleotidyltransferase substrate binding protein (TIGR01987 family)